VERFDRYDRDAPAVYLGEFAAHDIGRRSTLRSALAEAAYMTALERNGDVVRLVSYAPLLGKQRRLQWEPDLIYLQQLFGVNSGDRYLPAALTSEQEKLIAISCVQDSASGDLILKLVSRADKPVRAEIALSGVPDLAPNATATILAGNPLDENLYSFWNTSITTPKTEAIEVAAQFRYELPAHSLSVIRITTRISVE
jgi:alpha-L-arabinofuranosidase